MRKKCIKLKNGTVIIFSIPNAFLPLNNITQENLVQITADYYYREVTRQSIKCSKY